MIPKQGLKQFWWWVGEREAIRQRRLAGQPWPWTDDPILREYKFTNVFRFYDRVTQELWERTKGMPLKEALWHIVVHRLFNWTPTYDALVSVGLLEQWNTRNAIRLLDKQQSQGQQLFTGAYMVRAEVSGEPKHRYYCKLVDQLWGAHQEGWWGLSKTWKQEDLAQHLQSFRNIGAFVAYEMVTDLTYHQPPTDLNTWANAGPGAVRGLNRLSNRPVKQPIRPAQALDEIIFIRETQDDFCPTNVGVLLSLRDIEHTCCEVDKYLRAKSGEGRPRSKYHLEPS